MNKLKAIIIATTLFLSPLISRPQHTQKSVYYKMVNAGIKHPTIVLKQAIIESSNFKYKNARKNNNYLGFLNSKGNLMYFDSLESCLNRYRDFVQNRYKGGDYFKFLAKIGYASDPRYKKKVNNVQLDFTIE